MKAAIRDLLRILGSSTTRLLLLAVAICAPAHMALAQTTNHVSITGGNAQSGVAYSQLSQPLAVSISTGSYSGYDAVYWTVQGSGVAATFAESGSSSYTSYGNIPGAFSSHLVLGGQTGTVTVTASCSTCDVATFTETVTAPPPYLEMIIQGGTPQSGPPNTALAKPLAVNLIATPYGFDGPFTIPVQWQIISGTAKFAINNSQTFSDTVTLTGRPPNGGSQVSLILGDTPGPVVVVATCSYCTVGANRPFRLTITPPTTGALAKVSGDNQSGVVNTAAGAPLVVQAGTTAGQTVGWKIVSGQATLSAATSVTDNNGQATINFTYGNTPGPVTIEANVGNSSVDFVATAVAAGTGPTAVGGNNQSAPIGTTLQPFVVQIGPGGAMGGSHIQSSGPTAYGNIAVNWTVLQGGGTLATAQTLTDANGRTSNTLTLGQNPGVNIVQASVAGGGSITFTANGIAKIDAGSTVFSIASGNNQALVPGDASQPLVVKLATNGGAPIPNVGIQWSVSSSNGNLANTTTTTGSDGTSQNTLTVVLPGSYSVTAQLVGSTGIPPLTFNFSNGVANLPGLSPSQMDVAGVIDKACPALAASTAPLTAQQQDFLKRCSEVVVGANGDPQQVPGALSAMLNNKSLPQSDLAQGVRLGQFDNLNTRFAELRQGAAGFSAGGLTFNQDGRGLPLAMLGDMFRKDPADSDEVGKDFSRWGFFATGMIERGGYDATAVGPGFDYHSASLTAGVDYRFNANFVAGAALGYNQNNSSFDAGGGKADVDGYSLNGYFSWYHGDWYLEGSVVLDKLDYSLDRNIAYQIASLSGGTTAVSQTASASPSGNQNSFSLSAGKDFSRKAWTFSPYVRGIYSHLSLDGFSESMSDPNAPGAGLGTSVASRWMNSMLGLVGGRVSYTMSTDWGVLVPNAVVEWNHEFRNDPQTIVVRFLADPTQSPISLTDQAPDSNYFNLGFGLNAVFAQGRSAYVYYQHMAGYSGAHSDQLSLGIRIEF